MVFSKGVSSGGYWKRLLGRIEPWLGWGRVFVLPSLGFFLFSKFLSNTKRGLTSVCDPPITYDKVGLDEHLLIERLKNLSP